MDRLESDYNPNPNSNPIAIETPVYMRMIPKIKMRLARFGTREERTRHPFDDIDYTYTQIGSPHKQPPPVVSHNDLGAIRGKFVNATHVLLD